MKTSTGRPLDATPFQIERVRELRSRCCTSHQRFDRITAHLAEDRLRLSINMRRKGLLATRGALRYRVKIKHGLKLRMIALHNSIRLSGDSGCAMPVWKLAERLQCSESQYRACFRELVDCGVFVSMPFYVPLKFVNRHDVRRGDRPRCYSRSRRANVVVFGTVGLSLVRARGGDAGKLVELGSTPSLSTALLFADSKFRVDKLCVESGKYTLQKPEGNGSENFKSENSRAVDREGVEPSSTSFPASDDASITQRCANGVDVSLRASVRAWLADKKE